MVNNQLPAKEVYKRLLFKERMHKKVAKADAGIKKAYQKLHDLQETCPHYDSEYRNYGNGEDSYWRNYECHDCGKKWQTDQAYELYKKYPYAVDKTYG
jgi:transposase-like protein